MNKRLKELEQFNSSTKECENRNVFNTTYETLNPSIEELQDEVNIYIGNYVFSYKK